jgi:hypothetical protein
MKTQLLEALMLLTAMNLSIAQMTASDDVNPDLKQLHQELMTKTTERGMASANTGTVTDAGAQSFAVRFSTLLAKEDFSSTAGAALRIGMCADIAQRLVPALKDNAPSQSAEALGAIKQFLAKVTANIDDGWVFSMGRANIGPPTGVPNAAAGINPDAISDPQLRKEYIARIEAERAKQRKNNQQTTLRNAREKVLWAAAGLISSDPKSPWTREEVVKHFGADAKTKAALEEQLRKSGRAE